MTHEQMKHLWRLLGQTWGSKFAENYGPAPNEAWLAALASFSTGDCKYALQKLILEGSPFPPTLPEFIAHAKCSPERTAQVRYDANGRLMGESYAPEPKRICSPEENRSNLQRLREMLKGVGR
jgi:hypothetical protein